MRISVKCSTAVHVLLMIATLESKEKVTSDLLAKSVGRNPVEIRKLLSSLKKAGIIDVMRGTGGATLIHDPKTLTLFDIFSAVDPSSLDELIGVHQHPEKECPIGKNINTILEEPYQDIANTLRDTMSKITLESLVNKLKAIEPEL